MKVRSAVFLWGFIALIVGTSVSCAGNHTGLAIAQEYPTNDEADQHQKLVSSAIQLIQQRDQRGLYLRDAHPKHHACLRAEFSVEANLDDKFRIGVFSDSKTYPAWIRYSNGSGLNADYEKDVRGIAIKLMEVEGEKLLLDEKSARTQDFLLINHNVLVTKDAADFSDLMESTINGNPVWYFFNPFDSHLKDFGIFLDSFKIYPNVLDIQYWSAVPYLFGRDNAVKYSVKPCVVPEEVDMPVNPSTHYLREVIREQLTTEGICLDFMVQFQTDPDTMLIEDAQSAWSEAASPFHKVATIRIPAQRFESEKQMAFCENISYTPWHSLPEHRPLGDINRARKEVYRAISLFRHSENGAVRREPQGLDDYLEN